MFPQTKSCLRYLADGKLSKTPSTPQPGDGTGDLKEIISLFISGTISSYLTRVNTLMGRVNSMTFVLVQ